MHYNHREIKNKLYFLNNTSERHALSIFQIVFESVILYTANNFGLMYSQKRISHNSFPNFIHIIPKSFMISCQELSNPKRNYENQI
jgi:hypothetical protein